MEALEDRVTPSVDFWSGGAGASDTNWTTAANWAGGVAPSAGDDLVFASGVNQTSTTNDFATGTGFGSIAISGSGYSLSGNAITLQGNLSDSGGDATVALPLTLGTAASILNTSSSGSLTVGAIDTNGNALTLESDGDTLTVNGSISGTGSLTKTGNGEVILTSANSYSGGTQINAGTLDIQNAQALGTSDGTAATGTTLNSGTLLLDGSFTVSNELLTLNSTNYYSPSYLQSNGNVQWTGNVNAPSGTDAYLGVNNGDTLELSGTVTGTGYVQTQGSGKLVLTGNDAFGINQVYGTTLEVDGSLSGVSMLWNGATLQGSGTVGGGTQLVGSNVYSSGSVGNLSPYGTGSGSNIDPAGPSGTGILQTGSLSLGQSTAAFELDGDTAGSGYDQLQASGSVNVSGATLQVSLGYTPAVGQQFTLIQNNSGSAVVGTFAGYAEGSLVVVGNVAFQITYAGGVSGHDVVLTRVAADVWTGGAGAADTNWTTAANWAGGVAPSAGDDLIFANGVSQTNTTNDFAAGTSFGSIAITGSGYSLSGNAVTLQGNLSDSGGDATISLPLTLGGAESIVNTSGGTLTLGDINQNGNALTLETDSGITTVNGSISGTGSLTKTGNGEVILTSANSYSGGTQINAGTLDIQNAQALGTSDGTAATGTTLNSGTLLLDGSFTVSNELLTLNSTNYYSPSYLQSNGNVQWTGNVNAPNGTDAYLGVNNGDTLELSGTVTGTGYVQTQGSGKLVLTGNDAFGINQVYGTTLEVDGSLSGVSMLWNGATLQGSGTVGGGTQLVGSNVYSSGSVGNLSPYGTGSGSNIDPAGPMGTGILQTGSLSLGQSTAAFELDGDTAGSGYDQLQASGVVNVSGATLQVSLGYTPAVGQQFTLIQNNSGSAVVGTFAGYGEGSLVVGNVVFQITYVGGASGHDVVLTRVPADVWTGGAGAADTNWTTAANWAGGVAPSAGDDLVFANGVTQTSTTNDYATGTTFGSIAISGSGYSLSGNAITLQGSLSDSGGDATVSLPLTLGAAASIVNTSSGSLTVGSIDTNGNALTLESDGGTLTVNGAISGSGSLTKTGNYEAILAAANSYSGGTQINAGTLDIQNAQALGTSDGTAATGTTLNSGTLLLDGSFTVSNELLTLNSTNYYSPSYLQSNGNVQWTGNVNAPSGTDAYLGVNNGDTLELSGTVTGTGYVQTQGSGKLVLTGNDAFGISQVYGTTLEVDGSLSGVGTLWGATLQGSGTVGGSTQFYTSNVYSSGSVGNLSDYGTYAGSTVDPAGPSGTGILQTGSLSLGQSTAAFELDGDTAGSGYDQLQASGSVNVSGATLQVSLGYTPAVGQQFTLIQNNSGSAVVGTFAGYGEGSLVVVGNVAFQITYAGGVSGHDVVLTVESIYPPTAVTATGGYSFSATVGSNSSVQTVASFTDSSPNKILDYQATVDWGDGNTSTATLANGGIVQSGNTFYVNLSHDYTSQGSFTITTVVLHEGLDSNSVTSTATVAGLTPTISVTDAGGTYNGSEFPATATVNGGSTLEGVGLTMTYYSGTYTDPSQLTNVAPLSGAPSAAGSYTVLAYFPGSTDYISGSALANFTIQQATPTFSVSDAGGTYNGQPDTSAAGSALSVDGQTQVSGTWSYTYYAGPSASGTPLLGPPTDTGTYTVVGTFTSSDSNYTGGTAQTTFTINPTSPTLSVSDTGGTYNGQPDTSATGSAVGIDGTTPVSGSWTFTYYAGPSASGTALSGPPANAGTYTVVGTFSSNDSNYTGGTAQTTFVIQSATPALSISDTGGAYNGQPFVATGSAVGIDGTTPVSGSWSYAYYNGPSATGTSLPGAPSNSGTYTVVGTFSSADTNYTSGGTAQTTFTISPAATTTSKVSLSTSTAVYGQPVTLTVTVTNTQSSVTPSGTVGFYNGTTEIGTAAVGADGIATLTVSTIALGSNYLTAAFSDPVSDFAPSNSPAAVTLTIGKASTTTSLTATTDSSVYGQAVTFTATVSAVSPSVATPTGSVTFKDGNTVLATVNLNGGSASFTISKLAVGNHSITAYFTGSSNFKTSLSTAYSMTVNKDATSAAVTSSVSKPVYGQSVTLTAKVTASSPGSGTPTGSVSFYDGTTLLGTATLSSGAASIKTTALSVGSNSITVVYGGDSHFLGTTSTALSLTVKQDSTTTKLTSSSSTAVHGTQVTFTATVLPVTPGSGTPTGTVSFWAGSTLLGTVNLSNGTAQLNYLFTIAGTYKIKAVYNGDPDFLASTSSVLTETIT